MDNFNKIKKILNRKNGYIDVITIVPIIVISITLLIFFIDLASYAQEYLAVKKTTDNILKIVSMQGQVNNTIPSDFPGILADGTDTRDDDFWVTSEIKEYLDDIFTEAGIASYTASAIFDKQFTGTSSGGSSLTVPDITNLNSFTTKYAKAEYGTKVSITIKYTFDWTIGGTANVAITRTGISEYKHRTQNWGVG